MLISFSVSPLFAQTQVPDATKIIPVGLGQQRDPTKIISGELGEELDPTKIIPGELWQQRLSSRHLVPDFGYGTGDSTATTLAALVEKLSRLEKRLEEVSTKLDNLEHRVDQQATKR